MNRRLGTVAIVLMALTALAGVLSYVFFPKKDPQNSVTQNQAVADQASSSSKSPAPLPSAAPEGQSSAANLPNQPHDSSATAQNSSTNRVAQKVLPAASTPRRSIADILETADFSKPGEQERISSEIRKLEKERKQRGVARARELGLPLRLERPEGGVQEVVDVDDSGNPVYFTTHNTYAAVTTRADVLQTSPYFLTGTLTNNGGPMVLGVWDGGSARVTHQEFRTSEVNSASRITVKDGAPSISHATHVAGTMIGLGYGTANANAKGMAPSARINSWDWNSDKSEMQANAATSALMDTNKILISNHSYGYLSGWVYVNGGSPYRVWDWYGDGTISTGSEFDYGRYNTYARDTDSIAATYPFYLMFRSAGNDRTDNPSANQTIGLSPGATNVVGYSSSAHPAGDGTYRGGYDTIGFDALAKNVVTVGSVADAVNPFPTRDISKALVSSFSCWGPTDDGRIKPDLVANGDQLYSPVDGSDAAYAMYSGTSMSSPNAAGSAALVAQQYVQLFGQAMRASTLKGLLLHTADDLGNPGPDYRYGWGLLNAQAATDLIRDHHTFLGKTRMIEGQISSATNKIVHRFSWDGTNPIRVTLAWTDPAGTSTTNSDLRTRRLVNNLDIRLIAPGGGTSHLPYVMPFVGSWTTNSMTNNAVTGTNNVDNVEQVYLATPTSGTYQAEISFQGTLTGTAQFYSLLISGSSASGPGEIPVTVSSATPSTALPTTTIFDFAGSGFTTNTVVRLVLGGQTNLATTNQLVGAVLRSTFNLSGATNGFWNAVVEKPGAPAATLTNAVSVSKVLWCEAFDGSVTGWSNVQTRGTRIWSLTNSQFYSRSNSYFLAGPSTQTTTSLQSPTIPIPVGATNLQLRFWHNYNLQTRKDAARLELSTNSGTSWFLVGDANSGASFSQGGYNDTLRNGTQSDISSNERIWTGSSSTFVESVLNFTNNAKFAGKDLRVRWTLASDPTTASSGWYVDSVALFADIAASANTAPVITAAKTTSTNIVVDPDSITNQVVTGTSIQVLATASDDGGAGSLSYAWSAVGPGLVTFENNGTAVASNTVASFSKVGTNSPIGDYEFRLTVTDGQGLDTVATFGVRLDRAASSLRVEPSTVALKVGQSATFIAKMYDQFEDEFPGATLPNLAWSTSGGGNLSATNNVATFTATSPSSTDGFGNLIPFSIAATDQTTGPSVFSASFAPALSEEPSMGTQAGNGEAQVTITATTALITLHQLFQIHDGNPKTPSVHTIPAGLSSSISFPGLSQPPSAPGRYSVQATINDPAYQGTVSDTLTISLPDSDEDGDGLTALVEYALNGSPSTQDRGILPEMGLTNSTLSLTAVVRTNLNIYAEGVTNLLDYADTNLVTRISGTLAEDTNNVPAGFQRQEFRFTNNASRAFLKLTIQQQ